MRKVFVSITVLIISLMLVACGGSTGSADNSKQTNELESFTGKPLTETMQKIEEMNYDATYLAQGVDFTDFIDSVKDDYLTGELTIDEDAKTVEVELVLASDVELDEQEAQLKEKLEIGSSWIAVEKYGKNQFGDDFEVHYLKGNINQSLDDENTWFLKASCTVGGNEKICEAKVTGTTADPEVIYFDVY